MSCFFSSFLLTCHESWECRWWPNLSKAIVVGWNHVLQSLLYNFAANIQKIHSHSMSRNMSLSSVNKDKSFIFCCIKCKYCLFVHNSRSRHLEANVVLDLWQHVLVHFMWQVSNGQEQISDLHEWGVAAEDDVSSSSSHIFLIDSSILVVNSVHCPFNLEKK